MSDRIAFDQAWVQQPRALDQLVLGINQCLSDRAVLADTAGRHVALVGIGASHAAAASGVQALLDRGISASRHLASERPLGALWPERSLVVGISQSGRSPETVDVVRAANQQPGVLTLALTNVEQGPLQDAATGSLTLGNQPDSFASTIGYTGTVVALDLLAAWLSGQLAEAVQGWSGIGAQLRGSASQLRPRIGPAVELLLASSNVDLVGSLHSVSAAEGGALLLREVARIPASAADTRNYLHGAMESAGDSTHIFLGDGREVDAARMLTAVGHRGILIGASPAQGVLQLPIPASTGARRAVLEAQVVQALASAAAHLRGLDIEDFVFLNRDTKIGQVVPPLVQADAP